MTTLVMAHGGRDPNSAELRVPPGMQIDFYADFDENMFFLNGLAVVTSGQLGTPNQRYDGDESIPNYQYTALSSEQLGWYLQLSRTDLPAWFVGNDLPDNTALCTDYVTCDTAGANDGSGTHRCDGVLGQAQATGETHLVVLACRGNMTVAGTVSTPGLVGADGQSDSSLLGEMSDEVGVFINLPYDQQVARWNGYPYATQVLFMSYSEMQNWADAHGARGVLADSGPVSFKRYYDQGLTPGAKALLDADPEIENALWAAGAIEVFAQDPAGFAAWFDGLTEVHQEVLLEDGGIKAWYQSRFPAPDHAAVDMTNRRHLKLLDGESVWFGSGAVVLLGNEHDPQTYAWWRARTEKVSGEFRVQRATVGAGSVTFDRAAADMRGPIREAIGRISAKSVRFT